MPQPRPVPGISVVLAAQGRGHDAHQLLPGSLGFGGEVLAQRGCQDYDEVVAQELKTHPEILGVHVQLLGVQLAELGKVALHVVEVLDGLPERSEHLLPVGTDPGVAHDGRGAGQVPKGAEIPLRPGVHDQQPGTETQEGQPWARPPYSHPAHPQGKQGPSGLAWLDWPGH
uniref:Uncharacterized protein n=1 Tax=Ornithorhynchus anatinus TaxID=9258 RepID=A0A6I8NM56_ORNAN